MEGTQERVSAAFVLCCHEMREYFLIRPALCTRSVIELRILLKYSSLVIRMLLKLTAKKRVQFKVELKKTKTFAMPLIMMSFR